MKRNRKYCKYYNQRGRVTAYCEFLGNNLLCNKVCNMYVEMRDKPALNLAVVSVPNGTVCDCENYAEWDSGIKWCSVCGRKLS